MLKLLPNLTVSGVRLGKQLPCPPESAPYRFSFHLVCALLLKVTQIREDLCLFVPAFQKEAVWPNYSLDVGTVCPTRAFSLNLYHITHVSHGGTQTNRLC